LFLNLISYSERQLAGKRIVRLLSFYEFLENSGSISRCTRTTRQTSIRSFVRHSFKTWQQ